MNRFLAADLNNLGAMHLQNGHLRTSLEFFRDALNLTLIDLEAEQHNACSEDMPSRRAEINATGTGGQNSPVRSGLTNNLSAANSDTCMEAENDCIQPLPSSVQFIQSQAINVIPLPTAYSSDSLVNMTIVSSIILFNLGIVYHLRGLEENNQSSACLLKACSLYQKSQVLLAGSGVPLNSTGNPVIDMLSMAIENNMAHVFFELSMYEDSRQHFDQLIAFALTVVPARYGDFMVGSLVDQQKSSFLLNAMILHAPKLAPAA